MRTCLVFVYAMSFTVDSFILTMRGPRSRFPILPSVCCLCAVNYLFMNCYYSRWSTRVLLLVTNPRICSKNQTPSGVWSEQSFVHNTNNPQETIGKIVIKQFAQCQLQAKHGETASMQFNYTTPGIGAKTCFSNKPCPLVTFLLSAKCPSYWTINVFGNPCWLNRATVVKGKCYVRNIW